jgi:hypothetical protein
LRRSQKKNDGRDDDEDEDGDDADSVMSDGHDNEGDERMGDVSGRMENGVEAGFARGTKTNASTDAMSGGEQCRMLAEVGSLRSQLKSALVEKTNVMSHIERLATMVGEVEAMGAEWMSLEDRREFTSAMRRVIEAMAKEYTEL